MARTGLIAIVLLFIGHFAAYTYLKPLLQQVFVLSPSAISLQLLAYGAIGLLGTFLGERLAERSLRATFILIAAMLAAILIVSPFLSGIAGATLMVMVWGLAFGAVPVCATNWMFAAVPQAPEAGQALLVCVIQIALASGALLAVLLYMLGMLGQKMIGLPAPVGMLFLAVLLKLANGVSPRLQEGSQMVYKFFRTAVTYPILFAVGVAITPWQELVNAFTVSNLLVIISTVSALVATGFVVGKKIGMHPIDVAIVSCCQSGQGGTGDVAILTSGNRMNLMPFAQIATRIGGAINVSLGLLFLSHFLA